MRKNYDSQSSATYNFICVAFASIGYSSFAKLSWFSWAFSLFTDKSK